MIIAGLPGLCCANTFQLAEPDLPGLVEKLAKFRVSQTRQVL